MADEIQSMAQIMEVSFKGISMGVKVGEVGLKILQKLMSLMYHAAKFTFHDSKYLKNYGKTNIKNLKKKSEEFGGVVPLKFRSKKEQEECMKKLKKSGVLFMKGPDYKDGSYSVIVSMRDIDVVKNILEGMYQNAVKEAKEKGEDPDVAEQEARENNRFESWSEYVSSSGLDECTDEKFDQINKEYFKENYQSLDEFKKKLNEDTPEAAELRSTLKKAMHETDLRDMVKSPDSTKINFNISNIEGYDKEKHTVMVRVPGVPSCMVELPEDKILQDDKKENFIFAAKKEDKFKIHEVVNGNSVECEVSGIDFEEKMKKENEIRQFQSDIIKDENKRSITINCKTLLHEETENAYRTRIPGRYGENAEYIWIDKKDALKINDGQTILTFIDKNKDYKIHSADGIRTEHGSSLLHSFEDKGTAKEMGKGKSQSASFGNKSMKSDSSRKGR